MSESGVRSAGLRVRAELVWASVPVMDLGFCFSGANRKPFTILSSRVVCGIPHLATSIRIGCLSEATAENPAVGPGGFVMNIVVGGVAYMQSGHDVAWKLSR
jgi:hypothetical protein